MGQNDVRRSRYYRVLGWIAAFAGLALALRLAVTVAVTPASLWSTEFVPVASAVTEPESSSLAVRASNWMTDPALARSLIGNCVTVPRAPSQSFECLEAVEYGLAAQPLSSELWLAKARLEARVGILDERFVETLANSYATGGLEAWVASLRLPFALRFRSYLPESMIADIGRDIEIVIPSRQLSAPLVEAFIADPFLREVTWDVIEQYSTLDQQEQLIGWIRREL